MSEKKKYGLKCFRCGYQFYDKKEVYRDENKYPICGQCVADKNDSEMDQYYEEKWHKDHPGVDRDQYEIDEFHKRKYGEY